MQRATRNRKLLQQQHLKRVFSFTATDAPGMWGENRCSVPLATVKFAAAPHARLFLYGRGRTWNRTSSSLPVLESFRAPAPAKSTAASRDLRMDRTPSICRRQFCWGGSVGIGFLVTFLYCIYAGIRIRMTISSGVRGSRRLASAWWWHIQQCSNDSIFLSFTLSLSLFIFYPL